MYIYIFVISCNHAYSSKEEKIKLKTYTDSYTNQWPVSYIYIYVYNLYTVNIHHRCNNKTQLNVLCIGSNTNCWIYFNLRIVNMHNKILLIHKVINLQTQPLIKIKSVILQNKNNVIVVIMTTLLSN